MSNFFNAFKPDSSNNSSDTLPLVYRGRIADLEDSQFIPAGVIEPVVSDNAIDPELVKRVGVERFRQQNILEALALLATAATKEQ